MQRRLEAKYFNEFGSFNARAYLLDANPCITLLSAINVDCDQGLDSTKVFLKLEKIGYYPVSKIYDVNAGKTYNNILVHESGLSAICLFNFVSDEEHGPEGLDPAIYTYYVDGFNKIEEVTKIVSGFKKSVSDFKNKISFVTAGKYGLRLIENNFKKIHVDVADNYNMSMSYSQIEEALNSDNSGLVLFTGPPGCGKSFLIKYLLSQVNKKFIFIPTNVAGVLSDPGFMSFALDNFKDSILIVEDGELILADRETKGNAAASTLLNITDGLFGDMLKCKIIVTINTENNVDKALLRKGRLLSKVKFDLLPKEQANKLLEKFGKKDRVMEPTSLADLYAIGEDNGNEETVLNKKIGF